MHWIVVVLLLLLSTRVYADDPTALSRRIDDIDGIRSSNMHRRIIIWPSWAGDSRDLALLERVSTLRSLAVVNKNITDYEVRQIAKLRQLEKLSIIKASIDDGAVEHLKTLDRLHYLGLCQLSIRGSTVGRLPWLPQLTGLHLTHTEVSDNELHFLTKCDNLRDLCLSDSQVTDAATDQIGELTSLERLRLFRTDISDRGLRRLSQLNKLKHLDLSDTQVTANGVRVIRRTMPLITTLDLSGTEIGDDVFTELRKMPALRSVNLAKTKVSTATAKAFWRKENVSVGTGPPYVIELDLLNDP